MPEFNPENEALEWGANRLVFDRRPEQEQEEQAPFRASEVQPPKPFPGYGNMGNSSEPYTFPAPTPPVPEWVKNIVARRRLAQEDAKED